jgi:hypothetical protein
MATRHHTIDSQEVRKRAAEIRQHWSPLEKIQRTGLPPDIPARLRQLFLGTLQPGWSTVACGGRKGSHPMRPS